MGNEGLTQKREDEGVVEDFVYGRTQHFGTARPRNVEQRSRDWERAYQRGTARFRVGIALLAALLAMKATFFSVSAMAAPLPPAKINVTLKPVDARPDSPVNVSWSLVSDSRTDLTGSVAYYFNNEALPLPQQPVVGTVWKPGTSYPGPQGIAVVPGLNQITVVLLSIHPGAPDKTIPKLSDLDMGQTPSPAPEPGATATEKVVVLAAGTARLTPAIPPSSLMKNGLTVANRQQLMTDYAPLLLYSYDHSSDEVYAPIDVLSFIKGSSLDASTSAANLPNSALQTPSVILDSTSSAGGGPKIGTISTTLPAMPAELYVTPLPDTVQKGAPWTTVMGQNANNVGLYGHVILLDFKNLDVKQFQSIPDASVLAGFATRYGCDANNWASCPAQIIKIEYWQFFGYSHDYQGTGDSIVDPHTDHTGDWCTVQLYVDASWWQFGRADAAILAVYHYMHGIQVGFDMAQVSEAPAKLTVPARTSNDKGDTYSAVEFHGPNYGQSVDFPVSFAGIQVGPDKSPQVANAQNNAMQLAGIRTKELTFQPSFQHPVVYVEWGGHEFWPTVGWSYTGASKHNGTGQYSYFGSSPIDVTVDNSSEEVALVTSFAGYWGAEGGGGPPQGPPLHCQWYWDPDTTPKDLLSYVDVCTSNPPVKKTY